MKKNIILSTLLLLILLLTACGAESRETVSAEAGEYLRGTWTVGGVMYNNMLIDVQDVPEIAELYEGKYYQFSDDGSFREQLLFTYDGVYTEKDNGFLLTLTTIYRFTEAGIEAEPYEEEAFSLAWPLDEHTLAVQPYDALMGRVRAESSPLIYVREDQESQFIRQYKNTVIDFTPVAG